MALKIDFNAASLTQEQKPVQTLTAAANYESVTLQDENTDAVQKLLGELLAVEREAELHDMDKVLKRRAELRKALASLIPEEAESAKSYKFSCPEGWVEFGPQSSSYEVNKPAVRTLLGDKVFYELATIGVTALRSATTAGEFEGLTTKKPGSRSVKAVDFGDQ